MESVCCYCHECTTKSTKKLESGFAALRWGPQEPYIIFIDWLQSAVRQQIDMQETADAVLKSLAYENANKDCKNPLDPVRNRADVELSIISRHALISAQNNSKQS